MTNANETSLSHASLSHKDVHKRLKKRRLEGYKKVGQSGSHEKWKRGSKRVTVPNHGKNYEIPTGTLRNIWKQAGWI